MLSQTIQPTVKNSKQISDMKQFWSTSIIILSVLILFNCQNSNVNEKTKFYNIPEIDKLSKEIEKNPKNAALYAARSLQFSQKEMLQEAEMDAEKALGLDSSKADYFKILADAYFENMHSNAAIKILQRSLGRFPQEKPLYLKLAEMQMIVEQYKDCALTLDMLFKISPDNPDGIFIRGQAKKMTGDTTEAIKDFEKVVSIDAENLDAYMELAIINNKKGDPITLKYLENVLRIDSLNEAALLTKAQYYHFRDDFENALSEYKNALIKKPQSANINYNMAQMYLEMGDRAKADKSKALAHYESAFQHFDNSTKFDVQFADAYYYKAVSAQRLNRNDIAIRDYENALRMGSFLYTVSPEKVEQELAKLKK
jgi:tetratricopeptide (TPR) repeat protein